MQKDKTSMKVIIVGGGAAGIGAAHTILCNHKDTTVELFEARDIYGGRARTDHTIKDFAFDMGAMYVQDPEMNPWLEIAQDLNFQTTEEKDSYLLRINRDGKWVDVETSIPSVNAVVNALETAYGKAQKHPNQVVAEKPALINDDVLLGHATSPYGPFTESAEVWQYVAADKERFTEKDAGSNLFVKRGFGTLVQTYGTQLAEIFHGRLIAHLSTPVYKIVHNGKQVDVFAKSPKEDIHGIADACIVTVPTAVIAANMITFEPPLPKVMQDAFQTVRLGSYKKVALELTPGKEPESIVPNTNYYLVESKPQGVWQYYRLDYQPHVLVVHAAGDFAAALDKMPEKAVADLLQQSLQNAYSGKLSFTGKFLMTNWSQDPYAQGAYSYTAPVGENLDDKTALNAREQISKPVGRLFFAGEAAWIDDYGTVAGAYRSGRAAARLAMQVHKTE